MGTWGLRMILMTKGCSNAPDYYFESQSLLNVYNLRFVKLIFLITLMLNYHT